MIVLFCRLCVFVGSASISLYCGCPRRSKKTFGARTHTRTCTRSRCASNVIPDTRAMFTGSSVQDLCAVLEVVGLGKEYQDIFVNNEVRVAPRRAAPHQAARRSCDGRHAVVEALSVCGLGARAWRAVLTRLRCCRCVVMTHVRDHRSTSNRSRS